MAPLDVVLNQYWIYHASALTIIARDQAELVISKKCSFMILMCLVARFASRVRLNIGDPQEWASVLLWCPFKTTKGRGNHPCV